MGGIGLNKIHQIALVMHDVAAAVPYYRDVLGMRLLFEMAGMAFFDADGTRLMLTKPSAPEFDHANSILYFRVERIDAAYRDLRARGATFDDEPHIVGKTATHEVWTCFTRDPERNLIGLMEERPIT